MGIKVKKDCRLIIDLKKMGIDCIEEFGRYNYISTQEKLDMHRHPNCIEICYLSKGTQEYILDTDVFLLKGGEIFLTFPGEYHGSGEFPEEKGCLFWLILHRPTPGKNFLGLDFKEAEQLFSSVLNVPERLFKGCMEYEKTLQSITKLSEKEKPTVLDQLEVKNLITKLLILTSRLGNQSHTPLPDRRIKETITYIQDNIYSNISICDLAEKCYLSESRFKHSFKGITGIPPAEYIVRQKIKKAEEELLKNDNTIQDIAYRLGFSSPAYFSTVFRKYTGYSPTLYIEHKKDKSSM